ncbi:MAG: flagellin, partial [Selenomonadaceae bacterium]|nr:flagellin [Selenomonadaceae bacterium]
MPMTIMNNHAAIMALGELNKNNNKFAKDLKKVSTGTRITEAADGASDYAISEKMRAKIRSLSQDIKNVQNGRSLLKTGLGGIDDIVDELRCLKELALNSCNDHNTDIDRGVLQKEFDARKAHIESIATDTNFNGIHLLDGRWKRKRYDEKNEIKERLIGQSIEKNITVGLSEFETLAPIITTKTLEPVITENSTEIKYTSKTEVKNSKEESEPIIYTTTISNSYKENTTTTVSSDKNVSEPIITQNGNRRKVVTTETIASRKVKSTSQIETETTTVTTQKSITDIIAENIKETVPAEVKIITKGTTSITEDGVYEFAPDYTGTLSVSAKNVQLNGPSSEETLNDVYVVDKGVDDLYIKNLKINNSKDNNIIKFDSSTSNKLHVLGNNSFTSSLSMTNKACINAGGGITIVGNGALNFVLNGISNGAAIGSDYKGKCGNIDIGQQTKISIAYTKLLQYSSAIGSGEYGVCGDISLGKDSRINVSYVQDDSKIFFPNGATIGCGPFASCGNITAYSGANIETNGGWEPIMGMGLHRANNSTYCKDIVIYSDVKINATVCGTSKICIGISHPFSVGETSVKCSMGSITIYSYPNENIILNTPEDPSAEKIGAAHTCQVHPTSVNLLSDYNYTEGGVLDLSEMSSTSVVNEFWEVTKILTDENTVETTITESRTTNNEIFDEMENIVITSVYEKYAEKDDKNYKPLVIHTGTKANVNKTIYIEDMRLDALGIKDTEIIPREKAQESLEIID